MGTKHRGGRKRTPAIDRRSIPGPESAQSAAAGCRGRSTDPLWSDRGILRLPASAPSPPDGESPSLPCRGPALVTRPRRLARPRAARGCRPSPPTSPNSPTLGPGSFDRLDGGQPRPASGRRPRPKTLPAVREGRGPLASPPTTRPPPRWVGGRLTDCPRSRCRRARLPRRRAGRRARRAVRFVPNLRLQVVATRASRTAGLAVGLAPRRRGRVDAWLDQPPHNPHNRLRQPRTFARHGRGDKAPTFGVTGLAARPSRPRAAPRRPVLRPWPLYAHRPLACGR